MLTQSGRANANNASKSLSPLQHNNHASMRDRNAWVSNWNRSRDRDQFDVSDGGESHHPTDAMGRSWTGLLSSPSSPLVTSSKFIGTASVNASYASFFTSTMLKKDKLVRPNTAALPSHEHLYDTQPCLAARPRSSPVGFHGPLLKTRGPLAQIHAHCDRVTTARQTAQKQKQHRSKTKTRAKKASGAGLSLGTRRF